MSSTAQSERPRRGRPKGSKADIAILKGAAVAFARLGYARCRIEDILLDANVSRTNFYRHFASKDDVYRQLVKRELRYAQECLEATIAAFPGDLSMEDRIRRVIARDVEVALEAGPFLRPMFSETGNLEGYAEIWEEKNRSFNGLVSNLVVDAGLARPDPLLLGAVLAGIEHVLMALHDLPGDEAQKRARGEALIWKLFLPLLEDKGDQ